MKIFAKPTKTKIELIFKNAKRDNRKLQKALNFALKKNEFFAKSI